MTVSYTHLSGLDIKPSSTRILGMALALSTRKPAWCTPVSYTHLFQRSHLFQIRIHGMESINGNTAVWIRIRPCMRHGSIVDRQYLYGFLMGKYCPVYHLPEIAEVAYAEALFGAQREDGHGYSGTFPVGQGEVNVTVTNYQCFVSAYLRICLLYTSLFIKLMIRGLFL